MNNFKDRFQNLGPVSHGDTSGIYMDVLSNVVGNKEIKNLAITGPYAAGKSSVINRFKQEAQNNKWLGTDQLLTISLADYSDTEDLQNQDSVKEDLELRILQQILYTSAGEELPHSRFNRISPIKRNLLTSLVFCLWLLSSIFFFFHPQILLSFDLYSTAYFLIVFYITIWGTFSVCLIESVLHQLKSKQIQKLSLSNLEFAKEAEDPNSILSKYFDEILYFFGSTNYSVIFFEDLDRFKDPKIFSKLRELNTLINHNTGIQRPIQFVYAIKDSMFLNEDRTKFFDFIVPVVPIAGTANSEDIFLSRSKKLEKNQSLKTDFLQNIAQFVIEPRLIHNIFNEYSIYYKALSISNLDKEKLFSLMLYKTIFAKDFEDLRNEKGALYDILDTIEKSRNKLKEELNNKIEELKKNIKSSQEEEISEERTLLKHYIGELVTRKIKALNINSSLKSIDEIESIEELENFFDGSQQRVVDFSNIQRHIKLDFAELENAIHPGISLHDKKLRIENKGKDKHAKLKAELSSLQKKKRDLESKKTFELANEIDTLDLKIKKVFSKRESTKGYRWQYIPLLSYLIRNNFIDDNYQLLTTSFNNLPHYTLNDQSFLLNVHASKSADFKQKIDNPSEICRRLKELYFSSPAIFNVTLLCHLLHTNSDPIKLKTFIGNLIENYDELGKSFLEAFVQNNEQLETLASTIIARWSSYPSKVFTEDPTGIEANWLIKTVSIDEFHKIEDKDIIFREIENNCHCYFDNEEADTTKLQSLIKEFDLEIVNISSISNHKLLLNFVIENASFRLNRENVVYSLHFEGEAEQQAIQIATYSVLMNSNLSSLKIKVEANIESYLDNVMFISKINQHENESAILNFLNNEVLSEALKTKVIEQQNLIFEDLTKVKNSAELLFKHNKIEPSWENIIEGSRVPSVDNDTLMGFIGRQENFEKLLTQEADGDTERFSHLKELIINSDILDNYQYNVLVTKLFKSRVGYCPNIARAKQNILLENSLISLNESTINAFSESNLQLSLLIVSNSATYLTSFVDYVSLDPEDLSQIIKHTNHDDLLQYVATQMIFFEPENFSLDMKKIEEVYLRNNADSLDITFLTKILIRYTKSDDLKRLTATILSNFDHENLITQLIALEEHLSGYQLYSILSSFPEGPFKSLCDDRTKPSFSSSTLNAKFLDMLISKGIIKKISPENDKLRIRTKRLW